MLYFWKLQYSKICVQLIYRILVLLHTKHVDQWYLLPFPNTTFWLRQYPRSSIWQRGPRYLGSFFATIWGYQRLKSPNNICYEWHKVVVTFVKCYLEKHFPIYENLASREFVYDLKKLLPFPSLWNEPRQKRFWSLSERDSDNNWLK